MIENGVVQEIIVERMAKRGLVGNIYKGKVCRVLPGMQAAFVDAGLERAAFLHASDIHGASAGQIGADHRPGAGGWRGDRAGRERPAGHQGRK